MKYTGESTREIVFPLGGIGTGSIGLGGDGHLMDWEIYNIQAKGSINPRTHFAIKAIENGKVTTKVVMGDIQKDFMGQRGQRACHSYGYGYGPSNGILFGLPHFRNTEFNGEFPVATITYNDDTFPGTVLMNAFNPFIPCDAKNSSIPGAFFEFEVKNTTDNDIKYQLAFTVGNPFATSKNRYVEKDGSCEGTCQHVWNYAYAMCYLFPELERSIRDNEFKYSTTKDGKMAFRMLLPAGRGIGDFRACVDGQMGSVIKCYREWKISGDNEWLKNNWENIKKILGYAWSEANPDRWDRNKDGVLEGRQHHTLDVELFGPSSWLEGFYLAALKAGAEMAGFVGDIEAQKEYLEIFEKGYKWTKENLFNGEYFIQKLDLSDKALVDSFDATSSYWNEETKEIKYQIGNGSSIDQMLGQWHADILGLGDILDPEQVDKALDSMMKNNYKTTMRDFANFWRLFSVYDEAGSIICVYPEGVSKPKIPIPYCEETMTGFEYSFSGLLMSRGKIEDGNKVVKAVRDRFDGIKRNPWNEFECGSNYARSMASFANIAILSGYDIDMPNKHIGFNPYTKDKNYSCIWSVADGWGNFEIKDGVVTFSVYDGALNLKSFGVKFASNVNKVKVDGKDVKFDFADGKIMFINEIEIKNCMEISI